MAVVNPNHNMRSEFVRVASFYPNNDVQLPSGVWAVRLAGAGFCRTEACSQYEVVCFSCGLKLDVRTLSRQSAIEVHRLLAPACRFVTGTSDNQPVPTVHPAVSDWLTQNFTFPILHISTTAQSTIAERNIASNGRPQDPSSRYDQTSLSQSLMQGLSNPDMLEDFTLVDTVAELGSDSSFLLNTTTFDFASAPTLPSGFFGSFHDGALDGMQSSSVGALDDLVLPQEPDHYTSLAYFGMEEGLMTDGEAVEPVGSYPVTEASSTQPEQFRSTTDGRKGVEERRTITFEDLGIIVQRPKRQDLASLPARLQTFQVGWSSPSALSTKEQLAEAGFYYAGYADCCRCFYCGGGLKNWEAEDHPWIEHARWFKSCPYVLSAKGPEFIEAVESLACTNSTIRITDVEDEIDRILIKRMGSTGEKRNCENPGVDALIADSTDEGDDYQTIERNAEELETENEELLRQTACKICLDKEASILYVPCGHLVTCALCAPSVSECPVCRQIVKGQIRVTSQL